MRKMPLVLATLAIVCGIGGTGHAAPFQPATEGPFLAAAGDRTPCADIAEVDRDDCCIFRRAVADARRTAAYAELASGWRGERLGAFARLIAAQDAFALAVAANEIDHNSIARDDAAVAEDAEKDAFLRTLRALVHGHATPRDSSLAALDAALNATYERVMAVRDTQDLAWGSVGKAGIRRTERAWLAYRGAFVAFAATLGTPDAVNTIAAELTQRRMASLEAFLED